MWCRFAGRRSWTLLPAREERWHVAPDDKACACLQRSTEWATGKKIHGPGSFVKSVGSISLYLHGATAGNASMRPGSVHRSLHPISKQVLITPHVLRW